VYRSHLGRSFAATALLALAASGAAGVIAAPSAAAAAGECTAVNVSEDITGTAGGTATVTASGLRLTTPAQASKVGYKYDLPAGVLLSTVSALSYTVTRQAESTGVDTTVAAYKIGVDADGDGDFDGTLVYEPYYNGPVTLAQLDADAFNGTGSTPGGGKWWYSAEPGNLQTLATFASWAAGTGPVQFTTPKALSFGVEQGTYNTGAVSVVQGLRFQAGDSCRLVTWKKAAPTTPPATRPATPPAATPTPAPGTAGGNGNGDGLPVTGTATVAIASVGGLLLLAGIVAIVATYRRRVRYTAP
jgi:LPXTG-motif cell wall-anchored protein